MKLRLLVVSLIVASTAVVSSPAAQGAAASAPVVGECHDLTFAELAPMSDSSAPVDCATTHTALTIQVTTIPDSVWDQGKTKRISYAVRVCQKARYAYFGLSPKVLERTLFASSIFFFPDRAQVAAGERFVRCDVVKHSSSKVYPLAADPRFSKITKDVAACMSARFKITACTAPHRFYPTAAVGLPVPRPRSGQETIAVARRCVAVTGRRPAAVSWPGGRWTAKSLGVCYRRD